MAKEIRMVRCCMAAGCTNSRKSYAIMFRFPKIPKLRKDWESQNIATFSLIASRHVQPGLFKSLVWVVEEQN